MAYFYSKKKGYIMESLKLLKEITTAFGPAGFEDEVVTTAKTFVTGTTFEDSTRNLYINLPAEEASKKYYEARPARTKPRIMIDAHLDEVGMMVQHVKPNGTIGFLPLAGFVPAALVAQKVSIKNTDGELIRGVVVSKPPHFTKATDKKDLAIEDLSIDVGSTSKEETETLFKIRQGCPIAPSTDFEYNEKTDIMLAKAFDCRVGVAAAIEVMNWATTNATPNIEVVGALSAQEEIGLRGAKVTANRVAPDIAIAFEGTPADDTVAESYMIQTALKKGPMLRHVDNSMITNPRYQKFALDLAKKLGIPVQDAVRSGGGTNGDAIHLTGYGIPTIVIGIPVRYVHTNHSYACFSDYKNAIKLAQEVIQALNEEVIGSF